MQNGTAFFPPVKPEKHGQTEADLNHGGGGRCKADLKQGGSRCPACQEDNGNPHKKGSDEALDHDKQSSLTAIIIAGKAEQERSEHTVDSVGHEVAVGSSDDGAVSGEDGGQQIPVEKGQTGHDEPCSKGNGNPAAEGPLRPFWLSSPHILCSEG